VRLEARSDSSAPRHRSRLRANGGLKAQPRPPAPDRLGRVIWQEHVEAELQTLRSTLTRIESALAEDRATVQATTGQWAAMRAASALWPEQMSQLRAQVDRLDERIRAEHEQTRDELEGLQDDIGRLGAYTLQTQVQERMINRVEEEQARLTEAVDAMSRGLFVERARANAVIMVGATVALVSTTALLLANAPHFW
jgi:septal ring factor EnvC (AmiA/AmiB activator)